MTHPVINSIRALRRIPWTALGLLALIALLAACASNPALETGDIRVQVSPATADVELVSMRDGSVTRPQTVRTSEDGSTKELRYQPLVGEHAVRASASGHYGFDGAYPVVQGGSVRLALTLHAQEPEVQAKGGGLPDLTVRLSPHTGRVEVTGDGKVRRQAEAVVDDGQETVLDVRYKLDAGSYVVQAAAEDHVSSDTSISLERGDSLTLPIALEPVASGDEPTGNDGDGGEADEETDGADETTDDGAGSDGTTDEGGTDDGTADDGTSDEGTTDDGTSDGGLRGYEAEEAAAGSDFVSREDSHASNGAYLVQPATIAASTSGDEAASIPFTVEASGAYSLWVRLNGPASDADATYLGFDGTTSRIFTPGHGTYLWLEVERRELAAGDHRISIGFGEPGLIVDLFAIAADGTLTAQDLEAHFIGSESASDGSEPVAEETTDDGTSSDGSRDLSSLRGDPTFSTASLTTAQRDAYDRVWAAIRNPDARKNPDYLASSDDVYQYGRNLHTHLQSLLLMFRATGDLALLDEVDRLAELMRSQLADEWRDTLDGTDGTRDGYLNWVFRYGSYSEYEGKDNHKTNEIKTHAIVAAVAHALDVNRDLASPAGRDYAGHADAWRDYLVNHFEPKWRERLGILSGFPYLLRPHTHTYMSSMKFYYYMHDLTGASGYLDEARRESRMMWDYEFRPVSTSLGDGYVWARSVLSEGGSGEYLHPTTYARYAYLDFVEMHLEGFDRWADVRTLRAFANTFSSYVIDVEGASGDDWFTGDIGGDQSRGGLATDGWERMNVAAYSMSGYAMVMPWDASGRISDVTMDALADLGELVEPRTIHLAAGLFLNEYLPSDVR